MIPVHDVMIIIVLLCQNLKLFESGCLCTKEEKQNIETYTEYKRCFHHTFHPQEDEYRKGVFEENIITIRMLRSVHTGVEFSTNKFSHLTHEEFKQRFLGFTHDQDYDPSFVKAGGKFPDVDWRTKGIVAPIKNQKNCGSCYAFASISALESHHALKTRLLVTYSEQQIVDCSRDYGNFGCNGGLMDQVYNYTKDYGVMPDNDYGYIAKENACEYNSSAVALKITGWTDLSSGNEDDLTETIPKVGPVSVAIDAGQHSFMFYAGGVYDDINCSTFRLNHAVIAVGVYKDYYIVRNSWGKSWGENGYFKLARNHGNRCGIATVASYPNLQ